MMRSKKLPEARIYEQEYGYMPWGKLINEVIDTVVYHTPDNGEVLDLMCGTGQVLRKIYERRFDLDLKGVDINADFIQYAKTKNPSI